MSDDKDFLRKLEAIDDDFRRMQSDFGDGEIVLDENNEPTVSIKKTSEIRFDKIDNEYKQIGADADDSDEQSLGNSEIIDEDEVDYQDSDDTVILKNNNKMYIIGAAAALLILGLITYVLLTAPHKLYGKAYENGVELMNEGQYYSAIEQFNIAGNYKDSEQRSRECRYLYGISLIEQQKYREARDVFSVLYNYKDSADYLREATYLYAQQEVSAGEYFHAVELYSEIPDYKDVRTILSNDLFSTGLAMLEQGNYESAYQYFSSINNVKNRDICLAVCQTYLMEKSEDPVDRDVLLATYNICKRSDWDIAKNALKNPVYTQLKFSGSWESEQGGYYFNFNDSFEFNLPIKDPDSNSKFKFKNDIILRCDNYEDKESKRVWTQCFRISGFDPEGVIEPSKVTIECLENGNIFKMTRKKDN